MRKLTGVLVAILLFAVAGYGQTFRGGINGTINDPTGAVVAGAEVKATNNGTGVALTTTSTSGGEFSFQDLPLGSYKISVVAAGFSAVTVDNVPVTAGGATWRRRFGTNASASRRRSLYGVCASERCSPESITAMASSSGNGTARYSRVAQSRSSAWPRRPSADANWSITPTCTPVARCSARWHASAASHAIHVGPETDGDRHEQRGRRAQPRARMGRRTCTRTACGAAPSSSPIARTYARPPFDLALDRPARPPDVRSHPCACRPPPAARRRRGSRHARR